MLTFVKFNVKLTIISSTWDTPETFKLFPTEGIKPDVSCGVLNKSCFVTKSVVAVFSHAVKVSLVLPVIAISKPTVLVESVTNETKQDLITFRSP